MSWADRLLPASLGGASFLAQNCSVSVGRRATSIDLPMRDDPEHEDMGRRARRYTVTAVIVGDDYDRDRQALVDVLEKRGPHVFSHPWWGEYPVIVEEAGTFEESVEKGRGVSVNLTLTEAGKSTQLTATISPTAVMVAAIAAAELAAAADFVAEFETGLGDSFAQAAAAISEVSDKVDSVNNKIAAALGIADGVLAAMDELKDQAAQALNAPAALASALQGLLSQVAGLLGLTEGVEEEYPGQAAKVATDAALSTASELGAVDVTAQPPFPGGPVHPQTLRATRAIGKAVRTMSLVSISGAFRTLPLESATAAAQVLSTLSKLTDQLLDDPQTSDALAAALADLRAAMQQQLDATTGDLPATITYTPAGAVPALLIAWLVYGDPTRDLEIVARNEVLDPNFVPGGEELELLDA